MAMDDDDRGWEITFSDMLTLLLTFFVFIISVSVFKTEKFNRFWKEREEGREVRKVKVAPTTSFKFELIEGLKLPVLNPEAEEVLRHVAETFTDTDFEGVNLYYDENKISLVVSEELGFEGGQFQLKRAAQPLLKNLVDAINKSKFDVNIEGHSDTLTNPRINNMDLSLQRALAVARFLIQSGVEKSKVSVSGYGPHRPVAGNNTREGRQLNRRVEVNIIINND